MNEITSIIIHYKRPHNVDKWMKGIKSQSVPSKIIVWDNSGDYPKGSGEDVLIRSTENVYCLGRVLAAGMVKTKYIYNQDDDLAINDPMLFEQFIEHAKKYPDFVIGWNGRIFSPDINWDKAYQAPGKGWVDAMDINDDKTIDMINFGVSFLETRLINQIPINPFIKLKENEYKYADDIFTSYYLKKKRVMPFKLINKYNWLNEDYALSKQPPHMDVRNSICRKLFHEKTN